MRRARKITYLKNFVRSSTLAVSGLSNVSKEQADGLIEALVSSGKIDGNQGTELVSRLLTRMSHSHAIFAEKLNRATDELVNRLVMLNLKEIDALTLQFNALKERYAQVRRG